MKIKTNTGLAGASFAYNFGQVVDKEEFEANVGAGWEMLCEPHVEEAVKPKADETADAPAGRQKAVKIAAKDTR